MALFWESKTEDYHLSVWKVDESLHELLHLLPHKEYYLTQMELFTAPHRKQEWLAVRALLYKLLGHHTEVSYLSSGKPYLADDSANISISNTKGYVAVILSAAKQVGVDIEQYGTRIHRVASRFMRTDEEALTYNGDDTWSKLLQWSAKETMFKCLDQHEVDFKEHLYIVPFQPESTGVMHDKEFTTSSQPDYNLHYSINSDFVLTWLIV